MMMNKIPFLILLTCAIASGCTSKAPTEPPTVVPTISPTQKVESNQQLAASSSPPLYQVTWEICNVEKNRLTHETGCVKNAIPRLLWSPVGEAKAVEDSYRNNNDTSQGYSLAIQSAGCFPPSRTPGQQGFYNAGVSFSVPKGKKAAITLTKTLVESSKVSAVLNQERSSGMMGSASCKPLSPSTK